MRSRALRAVLALLVLAGFQLLAAPGASASPYCGITWGSQPRAAGNGTPAGSYSNVRIGQHDCYDRVVVDVSAPVTSWSVRYIDGAAAYAPGGAQLEVAAATRVGVTHTWMFHRPLLVVPESYRTLRSVSAGQGGGDVTSVWGGVRARLPFRAFVLQGPGSGSRLVVDVAHQWCTTGTTC